MKTKLYAFLAFFLLLSSLSSAAGDPKRELVEEYLKINNVQKHVDQMLVQYREIFFDQFNSIEVPPEKREEAQEFQRMISKLLFEEMNWENMKEDYIDLYLSVFTVEEIQALIDFSKSPIGMKLNQKTPVLLQKSMEIGQKHALKAMPRLQEAIREFVERNKGSE